MKVVYSNGTEGTLYAEQSKNLYIKRRFTKEAWKELENEMNRLDIVKFDDTFLSTLGTEMVSIEYVRNQVATH